MDNITIPSEGKAVQTKREDQELLNEVKKQFAYSSGSKREEFGSLIFNQITNSCYFKSIQENPVDTFKSVYAELQGIAPKDQIEGMLATQMIATHHAIMDCFRIIKQNGTIEVMNTMINSANKLSRTYTTQMEALNRHRGKVQQKMTVEHVHVNSGGQAIIANVERKITPIKGQTQEG